MSTAVQERPILLKPHLVRAILDGRKTVTRRVVKPQPIFNRCGCNECALGFPCGKSGWVWNKSGRWIVEGRIPEQGACWVAGKNPQDTGAAGMLGHCPYGVPGDRLWVKETWRPFWDATLYASVNYRADDARVKPRIGDENEGHRFVQMCDQSADELERWRPSIHMPRWASRLTLEVTAVRVERLQEITEDGARAEGVNESIILPGDRGAFLPEFRQTWDAIFAKPSPSYVDGEIVAYWSYPWDDVQETREHRGCPWYVRGNPWVWVVTFKKLDKGQA